MQENRIYYYSKQHPEFEIESIIIDSEEYVVGDDYKYLNGILTYYDITKRSKDNYSNNLNFISLRPAYDENELYICDLGYSNLQLIFSYNLKLLKKKRKKDIDYNIVRLEERLKALKGSKKNA